ncbi:hypothetical protein FB645_001364 [Coemansia sp. IMI 203386]|nr:hypothetical protein FB645_001364 [Coemansia sp. IMI 203386]
MASRLYRPISDKPDPSQMPHRRTNQRNAASRHTYYGEGPGVYYDAFETQLCPQATSSPQQECLNEFIEVNEDDENSSDPMLSATIRNLYEDMAPTDAQRSWNREYVDRAYPHNYNPINHRQQPVHHEEFAGHRELVYHHHEPLYQEELAYRQNEPTYRRDEPVYHHENRVYHQNDSVYHHEDPVFRQSRVRLPSVHSTSGYGMYPESDPIGPAAAGNLGRRSQAVECPWCHGLVNTRIKRRIGFKAGGAAVLVAAIAWPLFWVPLVVPGLHRKTHYCPQCRRKIGRGSRANR